MTQHINRFGRYDLDMEKPPPQLVYDRIDFRRTLPPPTGSTVYELTPLAQALEKMLLELGKWGSQFVPPSWEGANLLHLSSYALTPKTLFRAEQAKGVAVTIELHIDNEVFQVHIHDGAIDVRQGEARQPDVVLHTDMPGYMRLFARQIRPEQAVAEGLIQLEGDVDALTRYLDLCGLPSPA